MFNGKLSYCRQRYYSLFEQFSSTMTWYSGEKKELNIVWNMCEHNKWNEKKKNHHFYCISSNKMMTETHWNWMLILLLLFSLLSFALREQRRKNEQKRVLLRAPETGWVAMMCMEKYSKRKEKMKEKGEKKPSQPSIDWIEAVSVAGR